ncbi:TIGR03617 family F420-dependent LLM class oxidoreductase [Gordonia sp. CPCC 206044]|uniref:TIGR03617 family F420-dependent LLM class oxidoreductase n=1 Tax=Gordonia sp. CPCC 206044 TaxID=3140793 RepID=UPI003AF3F52A
MRVHVQLDSSPAKVAHHARELAELPADGLFTFEGGHDVFLPLSVAAVNTELDLMTNVAIAGPRSPLHLAHAAYDMQIYGRGRFRLGLGSQIRVHIEKRYGSTWSAPAARMGETIAAIKAIFDAWEGNSRLDFRGEHFTHTLMPPNFDPGPNPYGPPPVLLGALGPIMTRTAAEVADGLLVMPFTSGRYFAERTLPALAEGHRRAGRTSDDFEIVAQSMVAVGRTDDDLSAAIDGVATLIAFYGSTPAYRPVLETHGWHDLQPELNRLSKIGEYAQMRALIGHDVVRTIGVVGTPEECVRQIHDRFGAECDDVCCYFPGYDQRSEDVADLVAGLHALPTRR